MLVEAFCTRGTCVRWDINTLDSSLHPECPTCKGHNTWIAIDEDEDVQAVDESSLSEDES